jgi:hypothetical protein
MRVHRQRGSKERSPRMRRRAPGTNDSGKRKLPRPHRARQGECVSLERNIHHEISALKLGTLFQPLLLKASKIGASRSVSAAFFC